VEGGEGCASVCRRARGARWTGISLPVARQRSTVRCAVCSGSMPFPRPLGPEQRSRGTEPEGEPHTYGPRSPCLRCQAPQGRQRGCDQALVKLNLSLPQFLMITAFFRMHAACKGVLNNMRGQDGSTTFCGWEVARDPL